MEAFLQCLGSALVELVEKGADILDIVANVQLVRFQSLVKLLFEMFQLLATAEPCSVHSYLKDFFLE